MNHGCLPHTPFTTVKIVTVREVVELGDDGGFRGLNLLFGPTAFKSDSWVGPSWYLHHAKRTTVKLLS